MNRDRLKYLYDRYVNNQSTPSETDELYLVFNDPANDDQLLRLLSDTWDETEAFPGNMPVTRQNPAQVLSIRHRRFLWTRIAAAAAIIIIVGGGLWLFTGKSHPAHYSATNLPVKDIAAPHTTKATLQLANGQIITLENTGNGTVATQENVHITKMTGGQIIYEHPGPSHLKEDEITYNTLVNPRGSKVISLVLSDGTQVWLNSESSLTYPVVFIGNERKVEIKGEAYFEVTHNAAMPFIVKKDNAEALVLGTHFNINAFNDETSIKVTLLEGSVKVKSGTGSTMISPGQQAAITSGKIAVSNNVDIEEVMAWKNGYFSFRKTGLAEIMRRIARWYNVEVIYEGTIPDRKFGGDISSNNSLAQVMKILEETKIHFRIEEDKTGKNAGKIILTP